MRISFPTSTTTMQYVVNANFRGAMKKKSINLSQLQKISFPNNSKLHACPQQLVIRDEKGTIIFFSSGEFRVMGCIDDMEATFLAYKYTAEIDNNFPQVITQSYTSRHHVGFKVILTNLS